MTRLELATSGVTGRRSNQLSYTRICTCMGGEAAQVEELCISVNYTLSIILQNSDSAPIHRHFALIPVARAAPANINVHQLSRLARTGDGDQTSSSSAAKRS